MCLISLGADRRVEWYKETLLPSPILLPLTIRNSNLKLSRFSQNLFSKFEQVSQKGIVYIHLDICMLTWERVSSQGRYKKLIKTENGTNLFNFYRNNLYELREKERKKP